ncbi:KilA-N domain-containing protein [Marinomonas mediterranea]|uniref:KilA-N domain-containing protein n=1 Tax=Marinomonas mediterranea TaxID=119864 RepID=UPI002349869C|nr:KilA-N domain-containing protein [Marinomonas mediterranea]WCN15471.1 KilA-N domain-containing protein [Marinomonas mediterranea]
MANLTILSKDIRQQNGLYSLNDLHKASGSDKRHQPANFLRLETTQELIGEIDNSSDLRSLTFKKTQGRNGGTWVCKELVYAYAMWISPNFHLKVIRAFDSAQSSLPKQLPIEHASIPDESLKFQLINNIAQSMRFQQDTVVVPAVELVNMIQAVRMYQMQIAQLKTPDWVNETIETLKHSTGRTFADM